MILMDLDELITSSLPDKPLMSLAKGFTVCHPLSITLQVSGYLGEKGGTIGTWPTFLFFSPSRGGGERVETVKKEDASAGLTCGDWTRCVSPLYPSLR